MALCRGRTHVYYSLLPCAGRGAFVHDTVQSRGEHSHTARCRTAKSTFRHKAVQHGVGTIHTQYGANSGKSQGWTALFYMIELKDCALEGPEITHLARFLVYDPKFEVIADNMFIKCNNEL